MRTLYLVRHTTPNIDAGVCYGQADLEVTESFTQEVEAINKCIKDVDINTIYASPLKRCKVLAQKLFPEACILFDDKLKEIDFGDWELKKWSSIPKNEMQRWSSNFVHLPPPNGESLAEMNERASNFIKSFKKKTKTNSTVAVVTHSGIIRCIVAQCLSIPLDKIFRLKFNYASVVRINLYDTHEEVEILKS